MSTGTKASRCWEDGAERGGEMGVADEAGVAPTPTYPHKPQCVHL